MPFNWFPAFAGMTIKQLISVRYNRRHTREGGYPDVKMTFYEIVNLVDGFWPLYLTRNSLFAILRCLAATCRPINVGVAGGFFGGLRGFALYLFIVLSVSG